MVNIKKRLCFLALFVLAGTLAALYYPRLDEEVSPWHLKSFTHSISYGGSVIKTDANSYYFQSRTNPYCLTQSTRCNKALVSYKKYQQPVNGRRVLFSFDLTIHKYNFGHAPSWWVLFQDWVRIDPKNRRGNRPISTLEVKSYGDKLYLRHKDSAYQWGNDTKRTKQVNNGQIEIQPGRRYHIQIRLTQGTSPDSGGMALLVDGKVISDVAYQTKSPSQWRENVQEFGIYHDKAFDINREVVNRISFSLDNLTRREYLD